jgi:hypothetical protein
MTYKIIECLDVPTADLLLACVHLEDGVVLSGAADSLETVFAWRVGHDLILSAEEEDDAERLLVGYLLVMDVLRKHPEVLQAAAEALYERVAAVAPQLEVSTP